MPGNRVINNLKSYEELQGVISLCIPRCWQNIKKSKTFFCFPNILAMAFVALMQASLTVKLFSQKLCFLNYLCNTHTHFNQIHVFFLFVCFAFIVYASGTSKMPYQSCINSVISEKPIIILLSVCKFMHKLFKLIKSWLLWTAFLYMKYMVNKFIFYVYSIYPEWLKEVLFKNHILMLWMLP